MRLLLITLLSHSPYLKNLCLHPGHINVLTIFACLYASVHHHTTNSTQKMICGYVISFPLIIIPWKRLLHDSAYSRFEINDICTILSHSPHLKTS
jgi:hypothetical protein